MKIRLNGNDAELADGAAVAQAVAALGVGALTPGVAVAVAGEVVPRRDWTTRKLTEGESVEVVHAVQGG
ncbi:MAG: sulfur carrier protein ThiS [Actinomycetota bacterium]|nr:sulfur carrier protein ThiS [Actinomycetota bacterium]